MGEDGVVDGKRAARSTVKNGTLAAVASRCRAHVKGKHEVAR